MPGKRRQLGQVLSAETVKAKTLFDRRSDSSIPILAIDSKASEVYIPLGKGGGVLELRTPNFFKDPGN